MMTNLVHGQYMLIRLTRETKLPRILYPCRRQFELAFASAPISRTIIDTSTKFTGFSFLRVLFATTAIPDKLHEGTVRMEDYEIAFEVADKVKFHLCEL